MACSLYAGDIDFMLVPPATLGKMPCGPLLQKLLTRLLEVGLLVDELEPTRLRVHAEHQGSASFMGIARPPRSPYFRRIDVKVYPSRWAACSSLDMSRLCAPHVNVVFGEGPPPVLSKNPMAVKWPPALCIWLPLFDCYEEIVQLPSGMPSLGCSCQMPSSTLIPDLSLPVC